MTSETEPDTPEETPEVQLEPCPICGTEVEVWTIGMYNSSSQVEHTVMCKNPDCFLSNRGRWFDNKANVIAVWNELVERES